MGISSIDPERNDVVEADYQSVVLTVGTTAVEAKVGTTRMPHRQILTIYNDSTGNIYYGPSTVTNSGTTKGIPIGPKNIAFIPAGVIGYYVVADAAGASVIVQENA